MGADGAFNGLEEMEGDKKYTHWSIFGMFLLFGEWFSTRKMGRISCLYSPAKAATSRTSGRYSVLILLR